MAGHNSTNYCPIAVFDYESFDNTDIFSGSCSDMNYAYKDISRHEKLGNQSFCVLSSLVDESYTNPEYKAICYEMICSALSLTIKIGEYYIVCPREGGQIKAKYFNGYLLCPDYNLICTSTTLFNNLLNFIETESKEIDESFNYSLILVML